MAEGTPSRPITQLPTRNGYPLTEGLNGVTELREEVTSLIYQHEQRPHPLFMTQQQQQLGQNLALQHQIMNQLPWHVPSLQSAYSSPAINNHSFQSQTPPPPLWTNQLAPSQSAQTPELHLPEPCPIEVAFPRFAEGDPTDWLFKVECFFKYYSVTPRERFLIIALHLDRPAVCWFRLLMRDSLLLDWTSFVDHIHSRFGSLDYLRRKYIDRIPMIHQSQRPTSIQEASKLPIRRLSSVDVQLHRENDLCYNCDDKLIIGHRCKVKPTLLYLDYFKEEEDIDELQLSHDTSQFEFRISFNAFLGNRSSKSLYIMGNIAGQPVQVLIDVRSTHNFIADKLARRLHLPISAMKNFFVEVGDKDAVECNGTSCNTNLHIHDNDFPVDLFVVQLSVKYIILGLQWLRTLSNMVINDSPLSITFQWHGNTIRLQ